MTKDKPEWMKGKARRAREASDALALQAQGEKNAATAQTENELLKHFAGVHQRQLAGERIDYYGNPVAEPEGDSTAV
jgi:hypothetical protein